jgi:hypothetical protein
MANSLQQIQTGAGARLIINGKTIGFAASIQYTRSQNIKVFYEMDNVFPVELSPTTYLIQGTMTGFRLKGGGGLDGANIMSISSVQQYFNQQYCVIELIDTTTNKAFALIQPAIFDQDSWSISAKGVITFSATFKGTFMQTETTISQ